jgi:hypothetical protein
MKPRHQRLLGPLNWDSGPKDKRAVGKLGLQTDKSFDLVAYVWLHCSSPVWQMIDKAKSPCLLLSVHLCNELVLREDYRLLT